MSSQDGIYLNSIELRLCELFIRPGCLLKSLPLPKVPPYFSFSPEIIGGPTHWQPSLDGHIPQSLRDSKRATPRSPDCHYVSKSLHYSDFIGFRQ